MRFKQLPLELDEFMMAGVFLLFLMINYHGPLASIYNQMMLYIIIAYVVVIIFNLFNWIPILQKGNQVWKSIFIAAIASTIFIYLYQQFPGVRNLGQLFVTTAFGESEWLGKVVSGVLIPVIETIFFFRFVYQGLKWLLGWDRVDDPFSYQALTLSTGVSLAFTIFHATAKGITNNYELMATFAFGMLSMYLVIYFKQMLEAILIHIFINSFAVGLFALFISGTISFYIVFVIVGLIIFYTNKQGVRRFG